MDSDVGFVTVKENKTELGHYTNNTEASVVPMHSRTLNDQLRVC